MTRTTAARILFRLAEMVATRASSLAEEIRAGNRKSAAIGMQKEVERLAIELITFYAGECPTSCSSLLGSQNEVSGSILQLLDGRAHRCRSAWWRRMMPQLCSD